jgi:hypothetical protein
MAMAVAAISVIPKTATEITKAKAAYVLSVSNLSFPGNGDAKSPPGV